MRQSWGIPQPISVGCFILDPKARFVTMPILAVDSRKQMVSQKNFGAGET